MIGTEQGTAAAEDKNGAISDDSLLENSYQPTTDDLSDSNPPSEDSGDDSNSNAS